MQSQQSLQPMQEKKSQSPIFVEAEKLFEQMREFSQNVGRRAYEFFEERGREFGHELEDWFRAETELMRRVPVETRENDSQINVRAEVPGFNASDIKISVEARRLILSGKLEEKKEEKTDQLLRSEFSRQQFYRALDLPSEVDPAKTVAALKDGILELTLTKAPAGQAVNVEVKSA